MSFDERLEVLTGIADSTASRDADRLKAVSLLGRYGGLLDRETLDEELLRSLAADVRAELEDEDTLRRIRDRWVMTLGAHATGN